VGVGSIGVAVGIGVDSSTGVAVGEGAWIEQAVNKKTITKTILYARGFMFPIANRSK
jgi:hypothetical protein